MKAWSLLSTANNRRTNNISKTFASEEKLINITTDFYTAIVSNRAGGSIIKMTLHELNGEEYRYIGTYDELGTYQEQDLVSLYPVRNSYCTPCLASYDPGMGGYVFLNAPFSVNGDTNTDYILRNDETVTVSFSFIDDSGLEIQKDVTFYGDSYEINHDFYISNNNKFYGDHFELRWDGGLAPTEKIKADDVTFAYAMTGQVDESEYINQTSEDGNLERQVLGGNTDWVSVRNKYFTAALIADSRGDFATLESYNGSFPNRKITPVYSVSIGYPLSVSEIKSRLYMGPLEIENIQKTGTSLDKSMDFGYSIIAPIGKAVLWFLKFLQKTLQINYGFILIIFAICVRIITGPLTKKSFESTQNMQKIQPLIKKIQKKYKDNSTKMNQEIMALYKEKGVNPLGGCLPMLLQMPLLFSLFVVFKSTIEFRGAEFIFWISDLSQPDIIFNLPFTLPLYGGHVAILPVLMGVSIFLTQRMSMATMDPAQKPMMYIMNVFFVLLFNQFPSGLNLYYTTYNILNYFQQRSIRMQSASTQA